VFSPWYPSICAGTRRFRALKTWVIWRSLGRAGIVARLREQVRLANLLASWIEKDNRFELIAPVSMGVICFRLVRSDEVGSARCADRTPQRGVLTKEAQLDKLNSHIVEQINASGHAYITQTKLKGSTVIRIGLGNVLTTEQHVRKAWALIQKTAGAKWVNRFVHDPGFSRRRAGRRHRR
jgi:aromatic-L-amino-acid decarboxylase